MKVGEFEAWLASKGAENPCPSCGANEWIAEVDGGVVEAQAELAHVAVVTMRKRVSDDGTAVTVVDTHDAYMLTCNNCGFMRLHNQKVVGKNV